ncbi:MAG: extracellular solute-binding protein [Firmicutes bacterium]|nr:extracellular solute-binding protein [Bacillota bacterium]
MLSRKRLQFAFVVLAMSVMVLAGTALAKQGPDKVVIWTTNPSETVADWNKDPILQEVEKATNTDIEMVVVSGTLTDQINAAIASGTLPDIIPVVGPEQFGVTRRWATDGVLAAYEGDVAAAAPNVLRQYEMNPTLNELKIDGKIYFQPVFWGHGDYPNGGLIHVRKDLLDKYGMNPPQTFDEYFKYLRTCKDNGNGTGVVFAGGGGVQGAISAFTGAYGVPSAGWVKVDDGFEFWALQPGVKQGLLKFREMVAEGLIHPGVWEMNDDVARTAFVSGTSCSAIFWGGGHIGRIQNDMELVNPDFQEWLLPALDAGAGSRGYTSEPMFWGTGQLGGMRHNSPVAAARVINFLVSEEGVKLTAVGIEGIHYTVKDGQIVMLDQRAKDGFPTEAGHTGAHPLATHLVSWVPQEWQNWALLYGKGKEYRDWFDQMWENQGMYQTPTYGLLTMSPEWSYFQPTSNELVAQAFTAIVKSATAEEASALYDQFVKDWLASGGAQAQAEMSQLLMKVYK